MAQIKVVVLRGGPSSEHDVSLLTGATFLETLACSEKYNPLDVLIKKDGGWTTREKFSTPEKALRGVDAVLVALHGEYGEDGAVQKILELHGIPYSGSDSRASRIGMNKIMSRNIFERAGLLVPKAIIVSEDDDVSGAGEMIFKKMPPNWVVKPTNGGSSLGVAIAKTFQELVSAIKQALGFSNKVLVEEAIIGRELTCGVVDNFRGERYYALPAIEIIPHKSRDFFDYDAKYSGLANEICPAPLNNDLKHRIAESAMMAHHSIGARHYSRTDFIVDKRGNIYTLEINTLPGMTAGSLLPKSLSAVGASMDHFLDHLIGLAISGEDRT